MLQIGPREVIPMKGWIAAGGAVAGFAALHHAGSRWGATAEELVTPMPGDELVIDPKTRTMHAITIGAPPQDVWPWLVQMGYHRAGWYTYPWVDRYLWHIENPSADTVIDDLQTLTVGDVVPDGEPGTAYYVVAEIDPPHTLVLRSTTHVPEPLRGRRSHSRPTATAAPVCASRSARPTDPGGRGRSWKASSYRATS
jgi:hypothetical protein